MARSRRRSPGRLLGALALLLLLLALLPLSVFLSGILPGGGRRPDPDRPRESSRKPGTLQVTVVRAEDRSPIEGAHILVEGLSGGRAQLTSGADGRATLMGLGAEPVRVEVVAGSRMCSAWTDPGVEGELLLAVPTAPVRRGTVKRRDGTPVAARVTLLAQDGSALASTRTDPEGRYELPGVPDAAGVCATPDQGAPAAARRGVLVVGDGFLLAGRLLGAGAGELDLYALVPARDEDGALPLRLTWRTDADGFFSGRLPEGARAWALAGGVPVRLAAGEQQLAERVPARGRVLTADDAPAAGAVLVFHPVFADGARSPLPGRRIVADGKGRFDASGFARMRYSVTASATGCATRDIEDVAPGEGPAEFRLEPGFDVNGFVVDVGGLPIAGASVRAAGLPDPSAERPLATGATDERGRFRLAGLGGDSARLRVTAGGYHPTTLEGVRTRPVRVVLQAR